MDHYLNQGYCSRLFPAHVPKIMEPQTAGGALPGAPCTGGAVWGMSGKLTFFLRFYLSAHRSERVRSQI